MARIDSRVRRKLADGLAAPMFGVSFLFLAIVAAAISQVAGTAYDDESAWISQADLGPYMMALLALWPLFVVESTARLLVCHRGPGRRRAFWRALLDVACPPLRMGYRCPEMNGRIWLPGLGWQKVSDELFHRLERFFSVPMIVVALMILPVLAVEHYWSHLLAQEEYQWLVLVLGVSTSVIWLAFATEFILMVSVAESKWHYCRTHWVDLAIIVLPLISFLRCLRALRATRLMRLGRVTRLMQSLSRMSRLYRLRGLTFRAYRALLVLDVLERIRPVSPERRLQRLRKQLAANEAESRQLRRMIEAMEDEIRAESVAAHGPHEKPQRVAKESPLGVDHRSRG